MASAALLRLQRERVHSGDLNHRQKQPLSLQGMLRQDLVHHIQRCWSRGGSLRRPFIPPALRQMPSRLRASCCSAGSATSGSAGPFPASAPARGPCGRPGRRWTLTFSVFFFFLISLEAEAEAVFSDVEARCSLEAPPFPAELEGESLVGQAYLAAPGTRPQYQDCGHKTTNTARSRGRDPHKVPCPSSSRTRALEFSTPVGFPLF